MIRHIFWDWNGTLADDAVLLHGAVDTAMTAIGHPTLSEEQLRAQFIRPLHALYGRLTGGRHDDLWSIWNEAFLTAQRTAGPPPLAPDALEAVRRWHTAGRGQSVLSRWPQDDLLTQVSATTVHPFLDTVRGARRPEEPKEEMLREETARRRLNPAQSLVIGDAADDVEAALAAGAAAIICDTCSFAPIDHDVLRRQHVPHVPCLSAAVDLALTWCS